MFITGRIELKFHKMKQLWSFQLHLTNENTHELNKSEKKLTLVLSNPWSIFLILAAITISTIHIDAFYYTHDTAKWFVIDVTMSSFIFFSLFRTNRLTIGYLGILVLVLLYWMSISLWWAPHKVAGIEFLLRFMNVCLFVYCLQKKYSKEDLTDLILWLVFLAALAFNLVFIVERLVLNLPYNVGTFSPIGFINNTSAVFNIWIPLLVIFCIRQRKKPVQLIAGLITTIGIVSILIQTGTRAVIIGLSVSELLIFLFMLKKNIRQAFLFLTISALLALGLGIYHTFDSLQDGRLNARLSLIQNSIGSSYEKRIDMLLNTWHMTIDNPWGVGVNNFEYLHPKYAKVGQENASPYVNEHQILRTPHNLVIKVFSELGYFGGLLFLLLLTSSFLLALINAWRGSYIDKWLFVALSATLFHSMVSAVLLTPVSLFFFALLLATIQARFEAVVYLADRFSIRLPMLLRIIYPAVIILSVLSISSEYFAHQGRSNFSGNQLEKALLLNPQNDRALLELSQFRLLRDQDVQGSLEVLDQFLSVYPYHIAALQMKAERHYQLDELHSSQQTLNKLLGFYPTYKKAQRLKQLIDIKIKRKTR